MSVVISLSYSAAFADGPVEIFGKMLHGALHRHGRQAAHGAERAVDHRLAEIVEKDEVIVALDAGDDAVDHLDATHRADAAGRALAAGFDRAEFHGEACLPRHVDRIVKHHEAAMADHRAIGGEGLIIHRQVELRGRHI